MNQQIRIKSVLKAIELVREARTLVKEALKGTRLQNRYEAYGEYGFKQLLGLGNPNDSSLEDILQTLEEETHV